ncbi:class I SAM-dependent methyltransferase [Nocardioides sp. MH1]|uniref:class I SAM-dependent methyltransferase n=1 Tax=Nocardioides sp. MH1 TaxID=3242490 RepID=UPI003522A0F8
MFFDDYPAFCTPGSTAASPRRLNLRHQAMIEANRDVLAGARVLDLASHDGRWTFAAHKAGARHVTGIEARPELVESARSNFASYRVPEDQYRFVQGDLFAALRQEHFDVDVVLCLGFIYHTLRYGELFSAIAATGASYCILDTKVLVHDEPMISLMSNRTGRQANAADDEHSRDGLTLAGYPSPAALDLMLDVYGYDVEERFDWAGLLAGAPGSKGLSGYSTGERVTLRAVSRTAGGSPRAQAR